MTQHTVFFFNSRLTGLFLRHRLWAWNCALQVPLLAMLPVASYLVGWWVLGPVLIALPLALAAGVVNPSFTLPVLVFGTAAVMLVMLPIYARILRDFVSGFFACLKLFITKRDAAETLRDGAAADLAHWTQSHD